MVIESYCILFLRFSYSISQIGFPKQIHQKHSFNAYTHNDNKILPPNVFSKQIATSSIYNEYNRISKR